MGKVKEREEKESCQKWSKMEESERKRVKGKEASKEEGKGWGGRSKGKRPRAPHAHVNTPAAVKGRIAATQKTSFPPTRHASDARKETCSRIPTRM